MNVMINKLQYGRGGKNGLTATSSQVQPLPEGNHAQPQHTPTDKHLLWISGG